MASKDKQSRKLVLSACGWILLAVFFLVPLAMTLGRSTMYLDVEHEVDRQVGSFSSASIFDKPARALELLSEGISVSKAPVLTNDEPIDPSILGSRGGISTNSLSADISGRQPFAPYDRLFAAELSIQFNEDGSFLVSSHFGESSGTFEFSSGAEAKWAMAGAGMGDDVIQEMAYRAVGQNAGESAFRVGYLVLHVDGFEGRFPEGAGSAVLSGVGSDEEFVFFVPAQEETESKGPFRVCAPAWNLVVSYSNRSSDG